MPKEKNFNPVQAQKKADKQKQQRKQKATLQAQRNEKLARRNPSRIQRDIDNLKSLSESGEIRPHERQRLSELERDLAAVNKARAALGDDAPQFKPPRDEGNERGGFRGGRGGRGGILGKRTRDGGWKGRDADESSDTDDDVKDIPMPRDTPPPIPRNRRKADSHAEEAPQERKKPTLVYEAAPQIRDLQKEAAKFVPTAVAQKMRQAQGKSGLLELEDFDKLQKEGYIKPGGDKTPRDEELEDFLKSTSSNNATGAIVDKAAEAAIQEAELTIMTEEAKGGMDNAVSQANIAERVLHQVEIEEVEDEDY